MPDDNFGAMNLNPPKVYETITALQGAFIWEETAEGIEFWSDVCSRLRELIQGNEEWEESQHEMV